MRRRNTRLNEMRRMRLYLEKERDMYILEGKGKEKGKTRKTRRKLPLISQWDRGLCYRHTSG